MKMRGIDRPGLHFELMERGNRFEIMCATVDRDTHIIQQNLRKVLNNCQTIQHVRDALPECLVNMHAEFSHRPRIDQEAWTLQNDPIALAEWDKACEKILAYSVSGLIY